MRDLSSMPSVSDKLRGMNGQRTGGEQRGNGGVMASGGNVRRLGVVYWAIVVAWIGLIFWFSHQPATESAQLSGGVLTLLRGLLGGLLPESAFAPSSLLHTLIRKAAHFLNFAVYGVWVALAVLQSGTPAIRVASVFRLSSVGLLTGEVIGSRFALGLFLRRLWATKIFQALLICLLTAISDEIHQLFIVGRSGEVRDVLIDLAGSAVGVAVVIGVRSLGRAGRTLV